MSSCLLLTSQLSGGGVRGSGGADIRHTFRGSQALLCETNGAG